MRMLRLRCSVGHKHFGVPYLGKRCDNRYGKAKNIGLHIFVFKNAFSGTYISYAQIGGCILAVEEVLDYSNLKVNGGTSNINIPENAVPVLGVVTIA